MSLRGVLIYLFKSLDIFLSPKCTKCPKGYAVLIYMCTFVQRFSYLYELTSSTLLNNMIYRFYFPTPIHYHLV